MIKERLDFRAGERPREPLHVVFHKNLHRAALDRARSLYRAMHSAARSTCERRGELLIV